MKIINVGLIAVSLLLTVYAVATCMTTGTEWVRLVCALQLPLHGANIAICLVNIAEDQS